MFWGKQWFIWQINYLEHKILSITTEQYLKIIYLIIIIAYLIEYSI